MTKYILIPALLFSFYSCHHTPDPPTNTKTAPGPDTFRYKELFEGNIDTIEEKEIPLFYGTWNITAIANAGGTILPETKIRSQVGRKLILTKDSIWTNFLDDTSRLENPKYFLKYMDTKDGDLRGTAFSLGYRDRRKHLILLITSGFYLEVIHFAELAHYYDGRIYFFTKQDPEPASIHSK